MDGALDQIGGEEALDRLVTRFYDLLESDPALHQMHRLHFRGHGLNHTRTEQFNFLCGFLGGRRYYFEKHGHMDLREIHAHVPIRQADAQMWLDTMDRAICDCGLDDKVPAAVRVTLHRAAQMLVNDLPDWRGDTKG
ncbi:group II truncated hemoglobin [Rhodobacteraceae bacterium N5(2021)]|uniref:Group II truncated hemoglobin n=1 Tax=Gymnodinialimonas phycosphaerae TaxID=2841589 RepID=A0A975YGQ9_9RHOB|nr:group II truncated hemoglobin [Gymnodinialimonas phycosphaerae]MBY4891999.1 group II truncated hemoglobin [Gymnodinialimonas phycosphaerae]